jgi:hypothetical protein
MLPIFGRILFLSEMVTISPLRYWLLNRRSDCRVCLPHPELKATARGAGAARSRGESECLFRENELPNHGSVP